MKKKLFLLLILYLILFGLNTNISIFGFNLKIFGFYQINELNYKKHLQIRDNLVNHPEGLPKKEVAVHTSFGFKNLRADIYRLEAIQYIGGNVIGSEYKKYLFAIIDLITELNPNFEHPYLIGQLLLPDYNQRYEKLSKDEQNIHIDQAELLGLKGMSNFCSGAIVESIKNEDNLEKIWKDPKYKNPCKSFSIPYYLAYIYYFNKKDPIKSSEYYKVASANEDSVEGAKTMSAIMQGKGGKREKSYMMFLNIAKVLDDGDEACNKFAGLLELKGAQVFYGVKDENGNNVNLDGNLVKFIEDTRNKVFGKFDEKDEDKVLSDTKCINYVNKSIRELNLAYIEKGNEKYKQSHSGSSAPTAKYLYEQKYIDFLPTDYQQYKNQGIMYKFDKELNTFDYDMETK